METRTTTLLNLHPQTLRNDLATKLDPGSVINLSRANKYLYQIFKPILPQQFLEKYIDLSAIKQVEWLLKKYPNFDASYLVDLCQSVLRQGDIDLLTMITKVREDVLEQIKLPEKLVDKTNTYDFSAVVTAIESGQQVEEELAKMRADLDEIIKERGFPFQALLDAYRIYDKKCSKHREMQIPWPLEKNKLLSVKVIGYLQRLSPAWLKKALATGIYNITKEGKACGDTFILQPDICQPEQTTIDPAAVVPSKGLGFDFCVNVLGRRSSIFAGSAHAMNRMAYLLAYLNQKQLSLENLCLCSEDTHRPKRIKHV